jgi:hypothetical protein
MPLTDTDRRRIAEGALKNTAGKRLSQPLLQFGNRVVEEAMGMAEDEAAKRQQRRQSRGPDDTRRHSQIF